MKVEISAGKLSFDISHFFEYLNRDEMLAIVDILSCKDEIIQYVSDQIFDGCTEQGSCGYEGTFPNNDTVMDKVRNRVIEEADKVAQKRIEQLQRIAQLYYDCYTKMSDHAHELRHLCRCHDLHKLVPPIPDFGQSTELVIIEKDEYERLKKLEASTTHE